MVTKHSPWSKLHADPALKVLGVCNIEILKRHGGTEFDYRAAVLLVLSLSGDAASPNHPESRVE